MARPVLAVSLLVCMGNRLQCQLLMPRRFSYMYLLNLISISTPRLDRYFQSSLSVLLCKTETSTTERRSEGAVCVFILRLSSFLTSSSFLRLSLNLSRREGEKGGFDHPFQILSRTFNQVHIQFWNFLTFPKYQKWNFWQDLTSDFFPTPPRRGVLKN